MLKLSLFGQTSLSDDFSDGDFSSNPTWVGQSADFIINTSNQLQLNNTSPSSTNFSSLVTTSTAINGVAWEFYVKLDFSPSTSNLARVYLVSDQQDLTQSLNGYFVQIGGQSGTVDDVSLFRQDSSSTVEIIDGVDGTVASSPEVRIRVTKNGNQEWELFLDQTAVGSTFVSQGSAVDSTYNSSSYFGVFCRYTSTRADKFFFDDFNVGGTSFQDTIAPFLVNTSISSDTSLELTFNEILNPSTALLTNNYETNKGIGIPKAVQFLGSDSSALRLTFSTPFINGEDYELTIQNITDTAGNIILRDTSFFTYFVPVPALYRDIVINEIYADFSPSNGLPEAEFVELFNASNKVFQLDGWTFSDASGSSTLTNYILQPGEHIILCSVSNTILFSSFGNTLGVSSLPSLNNTGDQLQLSDPTGVLIDEVNYTDNWYRDPNKENGGYTLEQINPFTPCIGSDNFIASNNSVGGTPGTQNSVFDTLPETTAPSLLFARVLSPDSLLLSFSEPLDTSSVSSAQYILNPTLIIDEIKVIDLNFSEVIVTLLTPLDSGIIYTISVVGIQDCSGNTINANQFSFVLPRKASYRDIVINEIYTDFSPSNGLPEAEFVEFFNASNDAFQLDGWTFIDENSASTLTPHVIRSGEFVILCSLSDTALFSPFGPTLGVANFPSLNNSGENIQLSDATGNLIDFVNYNISWYRDSDKENGGYSLEQINPFIPCFGSANFIASNNSTGGTPGVENSAFNTSLETEAPFLLNASIISPDSIFLRFNELLDTNSIIPPNFLINPDILVDEAIALAPDYNAVILTLNSPLDSGIIYALSVLDVTDCAGNSIDDDNQNFIALPSMADSNDVVINEILFNPRTGGVDFVELFNRSDKVIDLNALKIANESNDPQIITEEALILLPNEFIVLTENEDIILQEYPLGVSDRILEIENLPTYNDAEGSVYLSNTLGQFIDTVHYTDDQHFALLQDDDGVSLERISAERSSNDPSNFHSASETVGFATPGYKNSQAFEGIRFSGKITVEPDIFSPDNDGFQDVLNINYQFSAPGFVASISIFDRSGRLIKRLIQNELLGSSGTFSWDGITDDNLKARIGVYVVLIEAFNVNGNQEVFKEVITVAGDLD